MPATAATPGDAPLDAFLPPVAAWFRKAFAGPSPAQVLAWPAIRRGDNTLLLAPTGSGKTLAAFLCAIDDLFRRAEEGELADGVHVLYITPLKALGNDIRKNLLLPLAGIREEAGEALPEVRVAVRSGDTPQHERAQMARRPPHILITTPESLYLLLQSASMAQALRQVRTVIVDEVHAVCDSKRGAHLAVSLERLQAQVGRPLQRVGCSATLSPLDEIAAFLVGFGEDGRPRPCTILNAGMRKDLDVQAMAPLPDFLEASHTALWASAYELLLREIGAHTTTLVFANSRYKAERTVLRLREMAAGVGEWESGRVGERANFRTGVGEWGNDRAAHAATPAAPVHPLSHSPPRIGVHHGSMSKETRLEAEDDLKSGRLDALVATASLELGINVGAIDLVYQLESPKSVATGLQRIGRAGHLLHATSKGRVLVFERDELVEAAAVCGAMIAGQVDAIRIPKGCLDVLAQQIAGAVATRPWQADDLFALVRGAYPYTQLERGDFDAVLGMLAGEHPFAMAQAPRPLLLWDRARGRLSAGRSTAHVTAMCVGTIAETAEYEVTIASSNKRVGTVQSEFVDDCLRIGDVFVLGSSSWKVAGVRRNRLLVEEAPGATPTVPWWTGPVETRTAEVGRAVGLLRREVAARLGDPGLLEWLQEEYHLCPHAAVALADYVREQNRAAGLVPDHEQLLVETWRDELGRWNLVVHSPYGQRINKTWGVALAAIARRELRQDWSVTASNDVLLLTRLDDRVSAAPVDARRLLGLLDPGDVPALLAEGARDAAAFGSAFRETAVCALQILRAWQGKRVPLWLQNYRAQELHEAAGRCADYPVVAEVVRGYLQDTLDAPGLEALLRSLAAGDVAVTFQDVESPSPFAHALLIQDRYHTDHQMGRARRAHLLRLHRQVLQEVLSAEEMAQLLDARAIETLERRLLHRSETTQARTSDELAQAIRDLGDLPADPDAVARVVDGDWAEVLAPLIDEKRVVAIRLPECEQDPVRLVAADLWRQYHDAGLATADCRLPIGPGAPVPPGFGGPGGPPAAVPPGFGGPGGPPAAVPPGFGGPGGPPAAVPPGFGGPGGPPAAVPPGFGGPGGPTLLLPRIEDGTFAGFEAVPAEAAIPEQWRVPVPQAEARRALLERYLRCRGPVTLYEVANHTGWPAGAIEAILQGLVDEGTVARGVYAKEKPRPQWVNRANLEEIHRLTMGYLRRELAACAPYEVVDFVTRWQHVHPETRLEGLDGLRAAIRQLQGIEAIQGAWETEILPARAAGYRPEMLDRLILSGEVCWRRVGTRGIKRGVLALCFRKDSEWLARGTPLQFDAEAEADCDIPEVTRAVRAYFRERGTAFFDDVVEALGVDEGTAMRAVWHLAWCGELTCDTFECVRHADFQVTLSACYDLDSTPRKIASGRHPAERTLRHMRSRKLDPRLGRWSATERLVPPKEPLPESEVARRWAEQLLARWGIVSRDVLGMEAAASPWSALVPELKRLELMGKVRRGYFIESHQGEQYGLPEAIELLRDCRARRASAHAPELQIANCSLQIDQFEMSNWQFAISYLPDEPLYTLTNRDPANLYSGCLDMVAEGGELFRPKLKQGNVIRRLVLQAGQVLVYEGHQLVTLTRRQLGRCLEALKRDYAGTEVRLCFQDWNGHPVQASPAAGVLWEMGFRPESHGRMCWPPAREGKAPPAVEAREVFLPYHREPPPVTYGPEWAVAQAAEPIRPAMRALLDLVLAETARDGWEMHWQARPLCARYRASGYLWMYAAKSFVDISVRARSTPWHLRKHWRIVRPEDAGDGFPVELRDAVREVEETTDRQRK